MKLRVVLCGMNPGIVFVFSFELNCAAGVSFFSPFLNHAFNSINLLLVKNEQF